MPPLPPALGVNPVLAALVHSVAFLELSGDDAVDPDWAVEALEHVAHYLQQLPNEESQVIQRQLASIGSYLQAQGAPDEVVEFISGFLQNCGVSGEGAT